MNCPNQATIKLHIQNKLNSDQSSDIDRHVSECDTCRQRIDEAHQNEKALSELIDMNQQKNIQAHHQEDDFVIMTDEAQKILGDRYRVIQHVGHGGSSEVFQAVDSVLERQVAVKFLQREKADDPKVHWQEARIMGQLNHPYVAQIYEIGQNDTLRFIVMEWVDGLTLTEAWHGLTRNQRLRLFVKILDAISAAHRRHITHHDIKPSNIIVTSSLNPKILDFGLAFETRKPQDDEKHLYRGTPAYSAPEQIANPENISLATDCYGLGVVLYQLLTDRLPFEQIDPEALFKAIQTEYPELPSAIEQDIPIPLQNICLRALEKDPKKRYTDAPAFLNDIQRFLRGEKVWSRPSFVMDKLQDYIKYAPIDTPTPRSSPTVKVITNPVEDAKSILGGYSERALSRLGEKVLAALMADDLSKESLGFDIKELKEGMTYIRAVELLTMPQELGGIVEGGGLFMLPEEYADLNPGCERNLRGKRQIISSYGCPNRCNFCSLGMGHTTVVSTPYPILIQVYLRGWFPDKQYTQTIFMVFFYAAAIKMKEDSIFYLDDVCGAYLTDLITFAQTYGCSMGNFVMTAGCSPFDPTVQYAREAAKGFLDIVLPENTLLSVTFNLYRPELISAIADLDREGLETAVNAYVDMYEEFLMYFSRNNAVYLIDKRLFSPVEGAEDPRRVYEGYAMTSNIINKLQRAALERVKRSKHIDHNKIIYDTIRIKWYKYDYSRQMAESLRATEKDDKNLREFLSKLNYDIDYGLWPAV